MRVTRITPTAPAAARVSLIAVLDKGDEVVAELTRLAREQELAAAQLTAIGAFGHATLGWYDRDRRRYREIPVDTQVEVLSLVGDVALDGDQPRVHAHAVLGHADGSTVGGHLLAGEVWPTLEVMVTEAPAALHKRTDPETGLALIDPAATGHTARP